MTPTLVGADDAVSKNTTDDEIGPNTVTLSRSEGSVALGVEMLRGVYTERSECAQHDSAVLLGKRAESARRCIGWSFLVTLSRSEGSVALGVEMLRGVYTER